MNNIPIDQLPKEIIEERQFEFNKKGVPEQLKALLIEIEHNRRKWKSLYMAVWGLPLYYLTPCLIDQGKGDKVVIWGLPAAKHKSVLYTPRELRGYLTDYDKDIHIGQVIKIFTLLEDYLFAYYGVTENPERDSFKRRLIKYMPNFVLNLFSLKTGPVDFTLFGKLKRYLKCKNFASNQEIKELELAKETRNCFVHRRGLIDKRWLRAYKRTGRKEDYKTGDRAPSPFSDLENWTDIMIKIVTNSIKQFNNLQLN